MLKTKDFGIDLDALSSRLDGDLEFVTEGKVTQVVGLVIEGTVENARVGTLCEIFVDDEQPVFAEVVGFRGHTALLMPLGDVSGIRMGSRIRPRSSSTGVPVGDAMLGKSSMA